MANTIGAALGSAIAIIVLLYYAPIHSKILGISYSPRLIASWMLPIVDITVTLYLIAGNWFGIGNSNAGFMMTQLSIWTAIGLSLTVFTIRKFFINNWRKEYLATKRFGSSVKQRKFA